MKTKWLGMTLSSTILTILAATIGCNPSAKQVSDATPSMSDNSPSGPTSSGTLASETKHDHTAGEHGGTLVSLGRDSYHIETVFEADGTVRLYTLGKDETRVIDIEIQTLKGFVKLDGETKYKSIDFEANPQDGDAENRSSVFIGKLPVDYVGKSLQVTVPNIKIAGERFRLAFKSTKVAHDATGSHTEMPDRLADDAERDLYMVPAGRYTAADIAANGKTTASEKFRGIKSSHDMSPKEGDRICPITKTKANPKFTWIVDGQPYQFCCPPCIDEFVKSAKATTEAIADPDSYVKE